MSIKNGKLLYCHGVSEVNVDKRISTLEYKNRTIYDWLNDTFTNEFGSPSLHIPPITIDGRYWLHKIAQYTPDLLASDIYVASENSVSNVTTSYDSPDILPYDDNDPLHVLNKD